MSLLRIAAWLRGKGGLFFRQAQLGVPLAILGLSMALFQGETGVDEDIRLRVFDAYHRARPRAFEDAGVRVVDIDEESLRRVGQWPWPRTTLGRLVDKLRDGGAAAIAFDAVFSEPDRSSPRRIAADIQDASLRERLKNLPDNDDAFARSIAKGRVVMGLPLTDDANDRTPTVKMSLAVSGESPLHYLHRFDGAVVNLPQFEKAADGVGSFSFVPDRDAIVRRAPLLFARDAVLVPSLAVEALRVAQGARNIAVKTSGGSDRGNWSGERTGIVMVKIGQFKLPTDASGRVWVYYTKETEPRTVPAWKILENKLPKGALDGVIAFVGTSAAGLKDLRATPLEPAAAGVDVHANLAEQAVLQRFLVRPDWARGVEWVCMVVLGLTLLGLLHLFGAGWSGAVAAAAIGSAFFGSWTAFKSHGLLIDPLYPSLTVFLMYFSSAVISYFKSESERKQVKSAMGRYMSPALVEQLAEHPEKLTLGGETREMTFHFCDIRGFTTISEQLDPHGLTQFINSFLTPMTDIILAHKGVIDKYMGDCIMAFWNAPLDDAEHARHACQAALAMHEKLRELNVKWKEDAEKSGRKYLPIAIGTGLNSGKCIVGNMGSDQRFDYSVLGDDVNLASRLEGQSKTYGVNIVVGPRLRELAPEFAFVELDLIRVKGKTKPVNIYALVGSADLARREDFQKHVLAHGKFLAAYRAKKWDEAQSLLEECAHGPVDLHKLYDLYRERLSHYRVEAPELDWDGSYTATSK